MAGLMSIDLTNGQRFNNIDDDRNLDVMDVLSRAVVHRLSRGEIPHLNVTSASSNYIISDTIHWINDNEIDLTNTTFTIPELPMNTWVTSFDDGLGNITWSTRYANTTNTTSTLYTWSQPSWDIETTDTGISICSTNWKRGSSHISVDAPISERIGYDPYTLNDEDFIVFNLLERLSQYNHSNESNRIPKRLCGNDRFDLDDYYYSDILSRMEYEDDEDDDIFELRHRRSEYMSDSQILKLKAPFIKRVYVTNAGRSFDDTEFNFDMVLAQEHFNTAIASM